MLKLTLKGTILTGLVILFAYQITLMWFSYPVDSNLWAKVFGKGETAQVGQSLDYSNALAPSSIATCYGQGVPEYFVSDTQSSRAQSFASQIVKSVIEQMGNGYQTTLELANLWDRPHILLEFPYRFDMNDFQAATGKIGWIGENTSFNRIYLFLSVDSSVGVDIILSTTDLNLAVSGKIAIEDSSSIQKLLEDYLTRSKQEQGKWYISKQQEAAFNNNILLPKDGELFDLQKQIYIDFYFLEQGMIDSFEVNEYVKYFFKNPASILTVQSDGEIRLGNGEAVASYNREGLFWYENSRLRGNNKGKLSLGRAYALVREFMERDQMVNRMEYSLAKYETLDSEMVFYFNYYHRSVPFEIPDIESRYGMAYPIEVRVDDRAVVAYKRIMIKPQEIIIQGDPFGLSYRKAVERLQQERVIDDGIDQMKLCYRIDTQRNEGALRWRVETGKEGFFVELE